MQLQPGVASETSVQMGRMGSGRNGSGRGAEKPNCMSCDGAASRQAMNSLGFAVDVAHPRWSLEGTAVAFHLDVWSAQA